MILSAINAEFNSERSTILLRASTVKIVNRAMKYRSGANFPYLAWVSFLVPSQLTVDPYNLLIICGTYDTLSKTLADTIATANIAANLRTSLEGEGPFVNYRCL